MCVSVRRGRELRICLPMLIGNFAQQLYKYGSAVWSAEANGVSHRLGGGWKRRACHVPVAFAFCRYCNEPAYWYHPYFGASKKEEWG